VRVHDVRETVAALAVWQAMKAQEPQAGAPASNNRQQEQTS